MPLYEYECDACGHRFEVIQKKFSDAPIEKCPTCGGVVQKLPSSPAIQFKGSGWYITDYARAGKSEKATPSGKPEGGEASSETKGESKSESKAETKSEAKTDPKGDTKSDSKPSSSTATETRHGNTPRKHGDTEQRK